MNMIGMWVVPYIGGPCTVLPDLSVVNEVLGTRVSDEPWDNMDGIVLSERRTEHEVCCVNSSGRVGVVVAVFVLVCCVADGADHDAVVCSFHLCDEWCESFVDVPCCHADSPYRCGYGKAPPSQLARGMEGLSATEA